MRFNPFRRPCGILSWRDRLRAYQFKILLPYGLNFVINEFCRRSVLFILIVCCLSRCAIWCFRCSTFYILYFCVYLLQVMKKLACRYIGFVYCVSSCVLVVSPVFITIVLYDTVMLVILFTLTRCTYIIYRILNELFKHLINFMFIYTLFMLL